MKKSGVTGNKLNHDFFFMSFVITIFLYLYKKPL
jgi:hypothetical protein